jgi:anthraniloyl-CoA monooxygenase
MKVTIVGAGPAGLYLAILLKKIDQSHDVTILERNPPDATFGWGVVFSEETLGALKEADHRSYIDITDTFARWDRIDIHYGGRTMRSRGHAFSAISRRSLLAILQRRCRDLDVDLRFGAEIDDPRRLASETDLLIGADGVNSVVRRMNEGAFGTSIAPLGCKYVWFGTDLVLDAFTFVFKPTDHGLIHVHAYPFDEATSTWIVECPEHIWRRAGLDDMNEAESMAFCQDLFRKELADHRLMSNRSIWMNFLEVHNESWYHGNVVLIGDAAHTAHFSIGSGTKLAMEDSIALANAFIRREDLERALVDYELERQPVVERFQQAARESAEYFERVERQTHMPPLQFAFNLVTRSGRISHANLMLRDPPFVRVLDAWFSGRAGVGELRPGSLAPPPMFVPLTLGSLALRNRVVREGTDESALVEAARSGAGLVLTDLTAVSPEGRTTPECPVLNDDADLTRWVSLIDAVHGHDTRIAIQLGHAGRRAATEPRERGVDLPLRAGGWPILAASAIPYTPMSARPRVIDEDDMARVREAFASAAARSVAMGADAVELNFAHGYLIGGFLSPLTNRRTDAYGGSLEDRLRFPLSVLEAVSAVIGDRVLIVRMSVTDWADGGLAPDEAIEIARRMSASDAGMIHVAAGQTIAGGRPEYRRGFLTSLAGRVRAETGVPTLVGGYLTTPDEVNTIVGSGRADLCLLEVVASDLDSLIGEESRVARQMGAG